MRVGLIAMGESALRKDGDLMRKRKNPGKKQWRHNLPRLTNIATALYWLIRLALLLWDRFIR